MDSNTILLSIVIPVYNVKQFLRDCLDSMFAQNVPKSSYEIICVDDGSTDGSGAILDSYAQAADNMTVIHQENGGVSKARNAGLDHAVGQYIWFVDADDFIAADILRSVFRAFTKCRLRSVSYPARTIQ